MINCYQLWWLTVMNCDDCQTSKYKLWWLLTFASGPFHFFFTSLLFLKTLDDDDDEEDFEKNDCNDDGPAGLTTGTRYWNANDSVEFEPSILVCSRGTHPNPLEFYFRHIFVRKSEANSPFILLHFDILGYPLNRTIRLLFSTAGALIGLTV